jgi:putative nucleotidyltransferase with HDIG domain
MTAAETRIMRGFTTRKHGSRDERGSDTRAGEERPAPAPAGGSKVDVVTLLSELPMQQSAISRALVVLDDPNAGAHEVAAVLESDPALCARALQLANSAHFGMAGRVASVDQAVVTLGATTMRTLVVSSASGMFGKPADLPPGFWHHSVSVAAASAIAARMCSIPRGDAICAGLLHDLGTALLYRFDHDEYAARIADVTRVDSLLADETALYGADHAALGAEALAAWNLPPLIVDALRTHHHDPNALSSKLGRALILGEALARAAFDMPMFNHEPSEDPDVVFAALGLTIASVDTFVARTAEETETLAGLLGIN